MASCKFCGHKCKSEQGVRAHLKRCEEYLKSKKLSALGKVPEAASTPSVEPNLSAGPDCAAPLRAFEKALKALGPMSVKELPMDTEDKPQYRTGAGLSSRRFLRLLKKTGTAKAIVSFIGAPRMTDDELAQVEKAPKFVAECRSPDKVKKLFEKNILHVAVINRFDYPAPIKHNPKTPKQWFEKYYQVIKTETASDLPKYSGD